MERKLERTAVEYQKFILKLGKEYSEYKEFVFYEIEVHETNREILEKIVK
jgi:hypothetical protein